MVVRRPQAQIGVDEDDENSEFEGLIRANNNNNNNIRRTNGGNTNGHTSSSTTTTRPRLPSSDSTEITGLNLDHLTNRKVQILSPSSSSSEPSSTNKKRSSTKTKFYKTYYGKTMSISEYIFSHLSMLCYYYPYTCGCMVLVLLLIIMILIAYMIINPIQEYGIVQHDHSNIKSMFDIQMGNIDHWCLGGGNDDCTCSDPTIPISRVEYKSWIEAFKSNCKLVKRYDPSKVDSTSSSSTNKNIDVAFVGESIIEEIDGRWMGKRNRSDGLRNLESIFNQHFRKSININATYEGIALGIAGDTSPNVLWRLLHGEMPDYFQPKIWWISLGNNDLGRTGCSEEVVVIGILRVVEEILEHRPNARVVINSLFPMTTNRGGLYPVISDYEDSFIRYGNGRTLQQQLLQQQHRTLRRKKTLPPSQQQISAPIMNDDEKISEIADKEEAKRDKDAKKGQRHIHKQPFMTNPVMLDDVTKTHKYKLGTGVQIVQQTEKPLWTSIRAINKELKKFADKNDRVHFFDATDIFTKKISSNSYQLLIDRISNRGHPTELGFTIWENEIVKKMDQIIAIMKQEHPELFKPSPSWMNNDNNNNNNNNPKTTNKNDNNNNNVDGHNNDDYDKQVDDIDPSIFENYDDFYLRNKKNKDNNDEEDETMLIDTNDNDNNDDEDHDDATTPSTIDDGNGGGK